MKTPLLSILCITLISFAYGQSIYLKAGGGINIPVNSDYYYVWADQIKPVNDSITVFRYHESIPYSLGGGKSFAGSVGVDINKYLTLDFAVSFSKSSSCEFEIKSDYTFPMEGYKVESNYSIVYDAKSTSFTPSLHLKIPVGFSNFYSRLGLIFTNIQMERTYKRDLYNNIPGYYPSEHLYTNEVFDKNSSLGFTVGIGFEYYLANKFYLFGDVAYNYIKYVPESSRYTLYDYMGDDELETMSTNEKEFVYVSSYNDLDNNDPDKPKQELKHSFPFDHIAIRIGVKYILADLLKKE